MESSREDGQPCRVLYMDDNAGLRSITRAHLNREGYDVTLAKDGAEGLEFYNKGTYDIILVDQTMPKHTGLEVLRILSSRESVPPIIMVTVDDEAGVAVEALKLGAADYITKDIHCNYLKILPTVIKHSLYHRQLIREKKEAEKQQRRLEKLNAIGTLSGGIAHDFNNILAGIINFTAIIRNRKDIPGDCRSDIFEIEKLAWRGAKLTRALQTFARKGRYRPRELMINSLITRLLPLLRRRAGKNIKICFQPGAEDLRIMADPDQIRPVISNIFQNAFEAMEGEGILSITAGGDSPGPALLRVYPKLKDKDCVSLKISDTGIGMDMKTRERIFEPFFTTKEDKTDTGLGLTIAYGIVEGYGGCIEVESTPGEGSTFSVYLPAYREK
jgi:signal transduction histidine kinase